MKSKTSPFAAFQFRDFRLFWWGFLISRIGSEMQVVAVLWQVYLLTSSPFSLGLIGLARFLPVFLFSFLGGIAADRFNRRTILFFTHFGLMLFSFLLYLATLFHFASSFLIYLLIAGGSAISAFDTPARQSLVPHLVPKRYFLNAIGLNTILWQTALLLGPSLAGFLIGTYGVSAVYFLNTLSFLGVILALVLMTPPKQNLASNLSFNFAAFKEGFVFILKTPLISSTMLLDFFATFFSSATTLLPIFAQEILKVGPKGLGFLYAAPALGAVIGGVIFSSLNLQKNQGKILLGAVFLYGLATSLFGLSRSFSFALFFLFLTGAADVISTIIRNTLRQTLTPDFLRGRMVAVNMIFFQGGPQLGEVEAGFLAGLVGAPLSVVLGGLGTILATFILSRSIPQLAAYQGEEEKTEKI